ncbi:hypothetical protein [Arthrobacter crusticola]|nr:hypothetical protein [Arthrobacter crusticola]
MIPVDEDNDETNHAMDACSACTAELSTYTGKDAQASAEPSTVPQVD